MSCHAELKKHLENIDDITKNMEGKQTALKHWIKSVTACWYKNNINKALVDKQIDKTNSPPTENSH